jgi:hypothetical protein
MKKFNKRTKLAEDNLKIKIFSNSYIVTKPNKTLDTVQPITILMVPF